MTTIVDRRAQDDEVMFVCDFTPPRGSSPKLLKDAKNIDADFISVAYSPGKSVRIGSIFVAHWIKEHTNKEVVFTLATRDMNKLAVQSLLLGGALLGLENLVVLKGDEFTESELNKASTVNDFTPTGLLKAVNEMNVGVDYKGSKLTTPTKYCVGASIDLEHDTETEIDLTYRKIESGAQYFLLQGIFDPQPITAFYDLYTSKFNNELSVPIFCGIQIMAPGSMVFGKVPGNINRDLERGKPGTEIAIELIHKLVEAGFRSFYLIPPILQSGRRDYEAAQQVIHSFKN